MTAAAKAKDRGGGNEKKDLAGGGVGQEAHGKLI
jgi:hypothetical protein